MRIEKSGRPVRVIAKRDGWVLYENIESSKGDWLNIKLESTRQRKKRNFWMGWGKKELRLARNKDVATLVERLPDIHDWVIEVLTAEATEAVV